MRRQKTKIKSALIHPGTKLLAENGTLDIYQLKVPQKNEKISELWQKRRSCNNNNNNNNNHYISDFCCLLTDYY